jgi:dihydrofolate reductase
MAKVIAGTTMSLDGFIGDRYGSVAALYPDVTEGIKSAIGQAKAAAGDKDVTVVGGASTLQQCLSAGLADELYIDIMPVLLGDGLLPFDGLKVERVQLERTQVMEFPAGRTHLEFQVW